jgi:hypothetical protein
MIRRSIALFSLLLLLVFTAAAQREGNPENWCRGGSFPLDSETFSIGTVKVAKAFFYNDFKDDCPTSESCRERSYVVKGNKVVVARTFKGFACSRFISAKRASTTGWIKASMIDVTEADPKPKLSAWLGDWRYADNSISFTENKLPGNLNVTGNAFWKGLGDNIHIGELDGRSEPKGNILKFGESDTDEFACKATMHLVGKFLVVADNMRCGGANVTFTGVYRKER